MKICQECGRPMAEGNDQYNPAEELGDILLQHTDAYHQQFGRSSENQGGNLHFLST